MKNTDIVREFIPALEELQKYRSSVRVAHNAVRTLKSCRDAAKIIEDTRIGILSEAATKDEKGTPMTKDGKYVFPTVVSESEAVNKIGELYEMESPINIFPVSEEDFNSVKEIEIGVFEKLLQHGFILEKT